MRQKIIVFFILFLLSINSAKAASYMYLGSSADSKVYIYDVTSLAHTLVGSVDVGKDPAGIAVSPDGSRVYVVNNGAKSVSVIDTTNNIKITDVTVGNSPFNVIVDPDNSRVFVTNVFDSTLSVIDTKKVGVDSNPIIGNPIPTGKSPAGLAITSNGTTKRLYVSNLIDGSISIFDISSSEIKLLSTFNLAAIPRGANPIFDRPVGITAKSDIIYVAHNEVGSKKSYVSVFRETNNDILYQNVSKEVGLTPQQVLISNDFNFLYVTTANAGSTSLDILTIPNDKINLGDAIHKQLFFTPNGLSATPNGLRIYIPSTSTDGSITFASRPLNNVSSEVNTNFKRSGTVGNFISPELKPQLATNPNSIDFGKQSLGNSTPPQTVNLTYQFVPSMINSITSSSGDFIISHNCEISVQKPMGTTCTVTVNFQSGSVGDKTGSVVIESNASNNRLEIPLKGTIQDPNAPSADTNGGGNNGGGCSIFSNEITIGFGLLNLLWLTPLVYLRLKRARQR